MRVSMTLRDELQIDLDKTIAAIRVIDRKLARIDEAKAALKAAGDDFTLAVEAGDQSDKDSAAAELDAAKATLATAKAAVSKEERANLLKLVGQKNALERDINRIDGIRAETKAKVEKIGGKSQPLNTPFAFLDLAIERTKANAAPAKPASATKPEGVKLGAAVVRHRGKFGPAAPAAMADRARKDVGQYAK